MHAGIAPEKSLLEATRLDDPTAQNQNINVFRIKSACGFDILKRGVNVAPQKTGLSAQHIGFRESLLRQGGAGGDVRPGIVLQRQLRPAEPEQKDCVSRGGGGNTPPM